MKKFIFISLLIFMPLILMAYCNEKQDDNISKKNVIENTDSNEKNITITYNNEHSVSILITKNYGKEEIASKEVKYKKGKTPIDILVDNFEVETSYGGGFIKSINGIESKTKPGDEGGEDWLYFINGEEASVGANAYIVEPGDEIWFDFRKWNLESIKKQN